MSENRSFPKSVQAGIPQLGCKPKGWQTYALGDLLTLVERPVTLKDDSVYQLVTAKRSRGGIVARERLKGRAIKTKTQFRAEASDFLISRRQIAHGACGIVPDELNGAIVSNEYATLQTSELLNLNYLKHLSGTIYFQQTCFHSSIGVHVEKLVFNLNHWLSWSFHIPSLPEQRRIAVVLDEWDKAIALAEKLVEEKRKRRAGLISQLIDSRRGCITELEDFCSLSTDKILLQDKPSQWRCIELEDIVSDMGVLANASGVRRGTGARSVFRKDDVLFGKLRPYLNKYFIAEEDGIASTEFWVLRPDANKCLPSYMYLLTQSKNFKAAANRPTGSKMPRAEWELVRETPLYLPDLVEQAEITKIVRSEIASTTNLSDLADLLRLQKRGLMQKLLSGAVPVPASIDHLIPGSDGLESVLGETEADYAGAVS